MKRDAWAARPPEYPEPRYFLNVGDEEGNHLVLNASASAYEAAATLAPYTDVLVQATSDRVDKHGAIKLRAVSLRPADAVSDSAD